MTDLLIMMGSKSKRKLQNSPAIDVYNGTRYMMLRKRRPDDLRILIVSAKYGLIEPDTEISWYDKIMTREKAQDELKEIQKMKAEEELHAEENRIENLAKASILRSWLSNGEGWKKIPWLSNIKRDTDTDNFYIPSSTVMQINSDRNSGKLTPRSPIEEFVKYDWILKKNASTQEFLFRHKTEIMKVLGKASLESPFKGGE